MKVYKTTYIAKDVEKFKTNPSPIPDMVIADNFFGAYTMALSYEDENVTLIGLVLTNEHVVDRAKEKKETK